MKDEYGWPICPQCNKTDEVYGMGSTGPDNHKPEVNWFALCFRCKCSLDREGTFLQTI